jgi:AcrR family transcriptional regulator
MFIFTILDRIHIACQDGTRTLMSQAPGRPRAPETAEKILDAALRLLARDGYARMSLDAIAEETGVSKPTIYRRWSGKADLATAALRTLQLAEPPVDTGSTPGDLTGILENFSRSLQRPNGLSLIGTVLAEEAHTPELLQLFRERIVAPRRAMLRAVLERADARGELRPGADLDIAVSLLVGGFYARYLAGGRIPPAFAGQVVDIVWKGIAHARRR